MKLEVGDAVYGEIVSIKPYGAFVELAGGEIGMVHISEIAEEYVSNIHDYLVVGEKVTVKIIGKTSQDKLNLSIKRVSRADEEAAKYRSEMEEFKKALESGAIKKVKIRAASKELPQDKLMKWLKRAERELERLEHHRLARLSKKLYKDQD
jgi:S1 RNA binding domain protein